MICLKEKSVGDSYQDVESSKESQIPPGMTNTETLDPALNSANAIDGDHPDD